MIKREASSIFNDAKALLKEHKDPSVEDSAIDELCDNIVDLITCSYKAFNILHKESPSDNDIKEARILVDEYTSLVA